jgi:hypothetical protein
MLSMLFALSLVATGTPASDYLVSIEVDYREVETEAWLDLVDVLYIEPDHLIAKVDGETLNSLPDHTILDRGDIDASQLLYVELESPAAWPSVERLGPTLYKRGNHGLIRPPTEVAADFRMDGIRAIVPLRELRPRPARELPVVSAAPEMVADIVASVSEADYQESIQTLEDFVTRNARTASYGMACTYAHDTFESYGIPAEVEEFLADPWWGTPFTCWNVVAEKTGVLYPEQIYIICGHLDSTAGNPSQPETLAPGADDNGSGSAAVLEVARILSGYDLNYTLRFICFGAEEQGLCGSDVYAAAAAAGGDQILGVINLDMLLYGPPGHDSIAVRYNSQSQPLAQAFDTAASTYVPELNVALQYAPGASGSDHYSFWINGYAAIEGIESYLSGNPYYHETSDRLANYLIYFPFGTNNLRAAIATLATLAEPVTTTAVLAETYDPAAARGLTITQVGPNPTRDLAWLTLASSLGGTVDLTMFDVQGRALHQQSVELSGSDVVDVELRVDDLPNGVYLLRAGGASASATEKIVISR